MLTFEINVNYKKSVIHTEFMSKTVIYLCVKLYDTNKSKGVDWKSTLRREVNKFCGMIALGCNRERCIPLNM